MIWSHQKPSESADASVIYSKILDCQQLLVSYLQDCGNGVIQVRHSRWKKIHHVWKSVEVHKN